MARDLSPYSARRLLTQQLGDVKSVTPGRDQRQSPPRSRESGATKEPAIPVAPRRRSSSREPRPRDAVSKEDAVDRKRESSLEPYRKPRDVSRDRKHEGTKDRRRDRSTDRQRDGSRDRRRDRSRDRRRDRSKDRDTDRDRKRERSRDRNSRRDRSRSRDRTRKDKDKKDRASHSPMPYRSRKPRTRSRSPSASPPPKRRRRSRSDSRSRPRAPSPHRRNKASLPSQEVSFRGLDDSAKPPTKYGGAPPNKEKPNFKTTGALAKHANRVDGTKISLKYHEPAEARKPPPSQAWRLFVFKGEDVIDTIELWQKSCWLLGRSREVVDYLLEHPSSSGQHAVIQFRYIQKTVEDEFGVKSKKGKVKPYIIDLESSNGTELNGKPIEASRYCELRDKDILQFAGSEREYVVMLPPPE
ncbi:SMAD/FHA domain-containing protein [Pyrenochaeta sp. DS3sAY3a]|nr:SMAD/FHA domain-containing protein [Pyrenochaeta sp. DS3sAY3a]